MNLYYSAEELNLSFTRATMSDTRQSEEFNTESSLSPLAVGPPASSVPFNE